MATPAAGLVRLTRACVLAAVMLGLASVAHVAGGGSLPSVPVLALLAGLVAAECVVVTRWRLTAVPIVALLGAGQFALHEAFMLLAMPIPAAGTAPLGHHAMTGITSMAGMTGMTGMTAPPPGAAEVTGAPVTGALLMLLFHAVATLALAGLLAFGESALWLLWCWLAPATLRTTRAPLATPRVLLPVLRGRDPRPRLMLLLAADPRRGPPVPVAG